jgi:hypothetical protein
MVEWTEGRMDRDIDIRTNEQTDGIDIQRDRQKDVAIEGQMDELTVVYICMDRHMNRWTNGQKNS